MEKTSGLNDNLIKKWKNAQRRPHLRPIETLSNLYTVNLTEALGELAEIAGTISPVEMVTAVNHGVERDKWLEQAWKGKFTTPEFKYNRELLEVIWQKRNKLGSAEAKINAALSGLTEDPAGNVLRKLVEARLEDVKSIVGVAGAILKGDALAAKSGMLAIFGLPSMRLIRRAKAMIETQKAGNYATHERTILTESARKQLAEIKLDANAVRRVFLWAAEEYGLSGTRPIVVREGATAVTVYDAAIGGASVVIPADYEKNALQMPQLVAHEIGCHWRDSENMKLWLPQIGSGALKPLDELFYEGHAVTTEYEIDLRAKGVVREIRRLYYPVAIDFAYKEELLFGETAQKLYEIVKSEAEPKEATLQDVWRTTYRVYRGNPQMRVRSGYAFTKDRAYYAGRLLAHDLKATGLGYLLDYGTLSVNDLTTLMPVFQLKSDGKMPYPDQDLTTDLYRRLLRGEFLG